MNELRDIPMGIWVGGAIASGVIESGTDDGTTRTGGASAVFEGDSTPRNGRLIADGRAMASPSNSSFTLETDDGDGDSRDGGGSIDGEGERDGTDSAMTIGGVAVGSVSF